MKKIVSLVFCTLALTACGTSKTDTVVSLKTIDTPITETAQSQSICQPYLDYLMCSTKNAPEDRKDIIQTLIDDLERDIKHETPARVAQQCEAMIRSLVAHPEVAASNGCPVPVSTISPPTS